MTQSERAHPPLTRADLIWLQGWLNRAQQASDYDRWPLRRRAPFDDAARRQRLTVGFTHYGCWPDIPGQLDVWVRDLAQDRLIAASILRPEAERPLMQLLKYPPSPDGDILSLDVECDCPFLVAVHSSSEGLGITHTRRHGSRCGEVIAHWLDPQQVHRFSLWLGEG